MSELKTKCQCNFCEQMKNEAHRYYPRTFRWDCPNSNEKYVIEYSETTEAIKKQKNEILDKMADGTFGEEVQKGFIEGTRNLIKE